MQEVTPTNTKPLTKAEKKWLTELEALFSKAPKRLTAYTIGDSDLYFFDKSKADLMHMGCPSDGGAHQAGIQLAIIRTTIDVQGVSG